MNLFKKLKSIFKIILLTCLLLAPVTSSAEIGSKEWSMQCADKKDKKTCLVGVNSQYTNKTSNKTQTIATTYIQLGSKNQKKMDLVDKEKQTYKLVEENKLIPVLFFKLPLGIDLKKKPLIQIDKKNVLNFEYSYCNGTEGCVASIILNDDIVKLLQSGKELDAILGLVGETNNMSVNFPLKNFSKSYSNLLK
tara:strand:+ start:703 stop:1281 length:579 start_codon:yes stop_codon:yes gene_type:complete